MLTFWWPQLDLDHNFDSLLGGRYGNQRWMEALNQLPVAA